MTGLDVVVALPARDEQETVAGALHAVLGSLREAQDRGLVRRARVEVGAHRCRDETVAAARSVLARWPDHAVVADEASDSVGEVRDGAVRRGLIALGGPGAETWVLSTDADSAVPRSWVSRLLLEAAAFEVVAVVGMADLDRWHVAGPARRAYDALIAAGTHRPVGLHQHDHVYGANLGVRADAYLAAGGFPAGTHGEDHALVAALERQGRRVLRTQGVRVRTSGRLDGRARGGLAGLLGDLELTVVPWAPPATAPGATGPERSTRVR